MKIPNILGLIIVLFLVSSCSPIIITTLETDLFKKTLDQTPNPQLVDVRTYNEFIEGYLPGAILMDIQKTTFDSLINQLDKTRPVFVYCHSGKRSLEAVSVLEKNKFKVIYNLDGGINAWKNTGNPVVIPTSVQNSG